MEILIVLVILFAFTVIPVKVGANLLNIDDATLGICFVAVILAIVANALATAFIGEGIFPSFIALIITGVFFSWLFKTNTVTGFVLATISIGVQFGIVLIAAGFCIVRLIRCEHLFNIKEYLNEKNNHITAHLIRWLATLYGAKNASHH